MSENKLKLNPDKTEFIVFGAKDRYKWLSDSFPVHILGNCLSPTDVVRDLGVLFDAKFCFTNHINSVIKSCFISLGDLHRTRRFLSIDTISGDCKCSGQQLFRLLQFSISQFVIP